MKLRVRPAQQGDLMMIFEWANDPLTREMSFNQEAIPLEEHKKWFADELSSHRHFMVVEGWKGKWIPLGQVRINEVGEVSMVLAPQFRGQNLATPVIMAAIAHIQGKLDTQSLVAHIKQENIPSLKAFERVGFRYAGPATVKGHKCLEYTYTMG